MVLFSLSWTLKHLGLKRTYDNSSFSSLLPCGALIFGVFDAHLNKEASRFACNFIREYLSHNLEKCQDMNVDKVKKVLEMSFEKCQISMMIHKNAEKFILSGTTATVGIIIQNSLFVANVGDTKCLLLSGGDGVLKNVTETDNLSNKQELIRVIQQGNGWYENDLVCNKVRVTRALGDLWQIGALGWQPSTNLRYVNIRALKENEATVDTVKQVMRQKPISWCIEYHPHVQHESDLSKFSHIIVYTNGLESLITKYKYHESLINNVLSCRETLIKECSDFCSEHTDPISLKRKSSADNFTMFILKKESANDQNIT